MRKGRVRGIAQSHRASTFDRAASRAGLAVCKGKNAVKAEHQAAISIHAEWGNTGSVDLDAHFVNAEPNSVRWDYGLGVSNGSIDLVFWIEPHPASSTREVKRLGRKVTWLKSKLRTSPFSELSTMTDKTIALGHNPYRWVHAGSIHIARNSREARELARAGVEFPCRYVRLPS